jgi:4-hydroxy-tetrahydrodipicolinate reductase
MTDGIEIAAAVEKAGHPVIGQDVGETLGLGKKGVPISPGLEAVIGKGDVVIDFTHHEASVEHLRIAADNKKAIVIGTTGFSADQMAKIKELAAKTRCVLRWRQRHVQGPRICHRHRRRGFRHRDHRGPS